MIQCPDCRAMIPDDSAFCDQCGKLLMWCPECGRPKRGTTCPVCGNDLIPGHKWLEGGRSQSGGDSSAPPHSDSRNSAHSDNASSASHDCHPERSEGSPGPVRASRLSGNGWMLTLQPGPFGRRGGIWPELSTCPYVSGNHGVIGKAGDNWTITDSGSTNGTYVNGVKLSPGAAVPLKAGDKVRIATLDFTVQ